MWPEAPQLRYATRVPGGTPSAVTQLNKEAEETAHYYPQFLPGGKRFLYQTRNGEAEKMGVFIGSLDGKPATRIAQTHFKAAYDAGSGRLLYMQGPGTLMARRLELDPPRLTGDPATVAEGVSIVGSNGFADFSISSNGTLVLRARERWRERAVRMAGPRGETVGDDGTAGGGDVWVQPFA